MNKIADLLSDAGKWLKRIIYLSILCLICLIFGIALLYRTPGDSENVIFLTEWHMDNGKEQMDNGKEQMDISLPFTARSQSAPVSLTARIDTAGEKTLYLKAVYTPLRVYADDVLLYEYGQAGSYPAFFS